MSNLENQHETTPELDAAFAVFGATDPVRQEPEPVTTEGDTVETQVTTEPVEAITAPTEVKEPIIVKAPNESEPAFNLRKRIAEKQAQKIGKSPEEQEKIQKEIRQLRGGFKEIAKLQTNTEQLDERISADYENPFDLEHDSLKVAELARRAGFVSKDELPEYIAQIVQQEQLNLHTEQANSQALDEFLASKPEFQDEDMADEFVDFVNSTGIDWNKFTPKQVKGLLTGFYIAEFGYKDTDQEIKKAIEVDQMIQSNSFSGGSASSGTTHVVDKELENAYNILGI